MRTEVEIKRTTLLNCLGTCDVNFQIIYATSNYLNSYYCPFCGKNIDIAYLETDVPLHEYDKMLEGQQEKIKLLKGSLTKQNSLKRRATRQPEKIRLLESSLSEQGSLKGSVERQPEKVRELENGLKKKDTLRVASDNSPPLSRTRKHNNDEEKNKKEQAQTEKRAKKWN